MADNSTSNAIDMSGSDDSSGSSLIAFKKLLNKQLSIIDPSTAGMSIKINDDPKDWSYVYLLDNYVLNEDKLKELPDMGELKGQYDDLPESMKKPVVVASPPVETVKHTDTILQKPSAPKIEIPIWTNSSAPDRFFSEEVYNSIRQERVISPVVLFAEISTNPNARLLKQMAQDIGFSPDKKIFTETDIGKLAVEMLEHQARELCIEKNDINNAIHRGDLMPNLDDLLLVEQGFGFPDESYFQKRFEDKGIEYLQSQVKAYGISLEESASPQEQITALTQHFEDLVKQYDPSEQWNIQYDYRKDVAEHRSDSFAAHFGNMDDKYVQEKAGFYRDTPNAESYVKSIFETPAAYFNVGLYYGSEEKLNPYDKMRESVYLPKLAKLVAEGKVGLCNDEATTLDNDGECTVESSYGEGDCNKKIEPVKEEEECTVESSYGDGDCGKNFSDKSKPDDSADTLISTNIKETTGNEQADCGTVEEIYDRRVDEGIITPCKIK